MEESRRRVNQFRNSRLLTVFALGFFCAVDAHALEADIFVSSFEVSPGDSVVVSITVPDSDPANTSMDELAIPSSCTLVSSRKEKKMSAGVGVFSAARVSSTVITHEWMMSSPGDFSFGPFVIRSDGDSVVMPEVTITVTQPSSVFAKALLRWSVVGSNATVGQPSRIVLEGFFSGTVGKITCEAPENALLLDIPLSSVSSSLAETENGWRVLSSYDWIPLNSGAQELPRTKVDFTSDTGGVLKVISQEATVTVAPESAATDHTLPASATLPAFSPASKVKSDAGDMKLVSFPTLPPELPFGKEVLENPEAKGNYAKILYILRRAEYTSLFPAKYRNVRLQAENSLGLTNTLPVPRSAWNAPLMVFSVILLICGFLLSLAGLKKRVFRYVAFPLMFCSFAVAISAFYLYTRDLVPSGVVISSALLHVPESSSTVIEILREGSTVRIQRRAGDWAYVSTDSSMKGWLFLDHILQYTKLEQ